MKKHLPFHSFIFIAFLMFFLTGKTAHSQQVADKVFTDISESSISLQGKRLIIPKQYRTLHLSQNTMQQLLKQAPAESPAAYRSSSVLFSMPMPDGSVSNFRIVKTETMEPALAQKYPEITTYSGQGIDDPSATIKLDMTIKSRCFTGIKN